MTSVSSCIFAAKLSKIGAGISHLSYDSSILDKKNKISRQKLLTQFEKANLLGMRAKNIQQGAIPNIPIPEDKVLSPLEIVELELKENKIPISIKRELPDGTIQDV